MSSESLPAARPHRIARLGLWMRRHQRMIVMLQWGIIVFYGALIIIPAISPLPNESAHLWNNLTRFAQFMFWGLWWPGVLISMLVFGRIWCGVLCPEGALSEWASRRGLQRHGFPAILKWNGWPFVAFVFTTIYGQLISVYEYPKATLVILGGSTLVAILIGFIWGAEKRLWCRYLCPVNGVFSLLSRLAPLHFRVDQQQWDKDWKAQVQQRRLNRNRTTNTIPIKSVNCAPLVNVRKMVSNSHCHMCSRCAGEHQAVSLSWRSMHDEILYPHVLTPAQQRHERWLIHLLLFGMLGLSLGAFQWTVSPWFVMAKQILAEWLIDHNVLWLLEPIGHWWILTDYPTLKDVLTPLDGLLIIGYSLTYAVLMGSVFWGMLIAATRLTWQPIWNLAPCFIPFAAVNLIVGLSQLFFTQLRAEGIYWGWIHHAYMLLIVAGALWSLYLIGHLLYRACTNIDHLPYIKTKSTLAMALQVVAMVMPIGAWALQFYHW